MKRKLFSIGLLCSFLCSSFLSVHALEPTIDTTKKGSITITKYDYSAMEANKELNRITYNGVERK